MIFSFISAITPGPNNIMIMSSGLNYGIRSSVPHLLGIILGFPILMLGISFGAGILFTQLPILHTIIKAVGIIYLVFLAWKIANSSVEGDNIKSAPLTFLQAAMFQWVNPKAWVMALSAFAAFTSPNSNFVIETFIIIAVFAIFTLPSVSIWLFFGQWLQRWLKQPKLQKLFNWTMALLLIFSLLPIIIELIASNSSAYYKPF